MKDLVPNYTFSRLFPNAGFQIITEKHIQLRIFHALNRLAA